MRLQITERAAGQTQPPQPPRPTATNPGASSLATAKEHRSWYKRVFNRGASNAFPLKVTRATHPSRKPDNASSNAGSSVGVAHEELHQAEGVALKAGRTHHKRVGAGAARINRSSQCPQRQTGRDADFLSAHHPPQSAMPRNEPEGAQGTGPLARNRPGKTFSTT